MAGKKEFPWPMFFLRTSTWSFPPLFSGFSFSGSFCSFLFYVWHSNLGDLMSLSVPRVLPDTLLHRVSIHSVPFSILTFTPLPSSCVDLPNRCPYIIPSQRLGAWLQGIDDPSLVWLWI